MVEIIRATIFGCPKSTEEAEAHKAWRDKIHDSRNVTARSIGAAKASTRASDNALAIAKGAIKLLEKGRAHESDT